MAINLSAAPGMRTVYHPRCEQNEGQPLRCASSATALRIWSLRLQKRKEGRPSHSLHGAVKKAPGGNGGNLRKERWRGGTGN